MTTCVGSSLGLFSLTASTIATVASLCAEDRSRLSNSSRTRAATRMRQQRAKRGVRRATLHTKYRRRTSTSNTSTRVLHAASWLHSSRRLNPVLLTLTMIDLNRSFTTSTTPATTKRGVSSERGAFLSSYATIDLLSISHLPQINSANLPGVPTTILGLFFLNPSTVFW